MDQKDFEKAIRVAKYWKESDPGSDRPLMFLAEAYYRLSDLDACEAACREGLALSPESAPLLRFLGRVHRQRHEFEEAVRCFERALPHDKHYLSTLEAIEECRGQAQNEQLQATEAKVAKQEQLTRRYFTRLSDAESELFELRLKSEENKKALEAAQSNLAKRQSELKALKEKGQKEQALYAEQLSGLEKQIQALQSEQEKKEGLIRQYFTRLSEAESKLLESNQQLKTTEEKQSATRLDLEQTRAELERMQSSLDAEKSEHAQELSGLRDELDRVKAELAAEQDRLHAQVAEHERSLSELQVEHQKAMDAKVQEFEAFEASSKKKTQQLSEQLRSCKEDLLKAESKLEERQKMVESFKEIMSVQKQEKQRLREIIEKI